METNIPGWGNSKLWATSRWRGGPERGSLSGSSPPPPARVPLGARLSPAFPGGRERSDAWVGGWLHVLVPVGVCPRVSTSPLLLPTPLKGLKTEGQLPRIGTWRGSGAPLSPPFASSPLLLRLHFPTWPCGAQTVRWDPHSFWKKSLRSPGRRAVGRLLGAAGALGPFPEPRATPTQPAAPAALSFSRGRSLAGLLDGEKWGANCSLLRCSQLGRGWSGLRRGLGEGETWEPGPKSSKHHCQLFLTPPFWLSLKDDPIISSTSPLTLKARGWVVNWNRNRLPSPRLKVVYPFFPLHPFCGGEKIKINIQFT